MTAEQGAKLWEGLCDPSNLDDKQLDYLKSIKSIYLNWRNAPDSYIEEHLDKIIPQALSEWSVDARGKTLKPATEHAWTFARKWALWDKGPTYLISKHL